MPIINLFRPAGLHSLQLIYEITNSAIAIIMPIPESAVFLITGCSTGLGRAFAETAISHGHRVIATARKLESIRDLKDKGASALKLDITASREDLKSFAEEAWQI